MLIHDPVIIQYGGGSGSGLGILLLGAATLLTSLVAAGAAWVAVLLAWRTERTARLTLTEAHKQTTQAKNLYEHSRKIDLYGRILDALDEVRKRTAPAEHETDEILRNFNDPEVRKQRLQEVDQELKAVGRRLALLDSTEVASAATRIFKEAHTAFYAALDDDKYVEGRYEQARKDLEDALDKANAILVGDLNRPLSATGQES